MRNNESKRKKKEVKYREESPVRIIIQKRQKFASL